VLVSAGRLSVHEAVDVVLHELHPSLVCIDSPSGWSKSGKSRLAERELRKIGITAFACGPDPGPHPFYQWMRVGFSVYEALSPAYDLFRGRMLMQTAAEVFPEATAVLLAGRLRNADETKRAFRSKVLTDNGVDLATLSTVDRIDAALAALTGILALRSNHTTVGDPEEGVILLPSKLPAVPLVRAPSASRSHIGMVTAPSRVADAGPRGQCQCGCGAAVRRRFLPGHDAKLKSQLFRAKATGDVSATQRLIDLGWLSHSSGAT
jgi:predicted nuclease with RNAse H fold